MKTTLAPLCGFGIVAPFSVSASGIPFESTMNNLQTAFKGESNARDVQPLAIGHFPIRDDRVKPMRRKRSPGFGKPRRRGDMMLVLRQIRRQNVTHIRLVVDDQDSAQGRSDSPVPAGSVMEN